jgi:spermidine/putrescine ABC transporter ATP-binding subunit
LVELRKSFGDVEAVRGVSFDVPKGAYVCLLGPSGCGKTTILRTIAGFHLPNSGRLEIDGRDQSRVPPNRRNLGMLYQNYALFPHLSVAENVAFGLKMRRIDRAARERRVSEMLDLVHLSGLGGRRPTQLSGGQQQRVALARAIAIEPDILLLDEPLSNLDAKLRKLMQVELKELQRRTGLTTVHVTHDQEEALTLADTVVILSEGRIVQIGPPREVYARPASVFVADFLGHANFLSGRFAGRENGALLFVGDAGERLRSSVATAASEGDAVKAFIRPELVILVEPGEARPGGNRLKGTVVNTVFSGSLVSITIAVGEGRHITVERQSGDAASRIETGRAVEVLLPEEALQILPA